MATLDFTEQPVIDRETASRLNPFIDCHSSRDTLCYLQNGLDFLSFVALSTSNGVSDSDALGLSLILQTMSVATSFEIETERVGRLKLFETKTKAQGAGL